MVSKTHSKKEFGGKYWEEKEKKNISAPVQHSNANR